MIKNSIELLDCTLRDGAYINSSFFGDDTIRGIIKRLQDAKIGVIECGWLKDSIHEAGSTYFHLPNDLIPYIKSKSHNNTYVVMIDYNRYNLDLLPVYDGQSIDAIRVVFPLGKVVEGIEVGRKIRDKGYKVFFQAANTLGYSDYDLLELIKQVNEFKPECISIVDTFGAMYPDDLTRILSIVDHNLDNDIKVGFHSHNNQQLSFALSIQFVRYMTKCGRSIIVDSSLCGMGRGAGNTTTELLTSFLNKFYYGNYDLDLIMDTIDMYMVPFQEKYSWGYSIPNYIAGSYCSHVNNIDYLLKKHRAKAKEIRSVISSLTPEERIRYDYDLLESKYIENQNNHVDDEKSLDRLRNDLQYKNVLLIAPGKTSLIERDDILNFIKINKPIVIGVNAVVPNYSYDYLFFKSKVRYEYALEKFSEVFFSTLKILLSNIKTNPSDNELVLMYDRAIKRGWKNFDNAVICLLRILLKLNVSNIAIAGFDKFSTNYNESYSDIGLPTVNDKESLDLANVEIKEILTDIISRINDTTIVQFVTKNNIYS